MVNRIKYHLLNQAEKRREQTRSKKANIKRKKSTGKAKQMWGEDHVSIHVRALSGDREQSKGNSEREKKKRKMRISSKEKKK